MKTIEELLEDIDDLKLEIDELRDYNEELELQNSEYEYADMKSIADKSEEVRRTFDAGFDAGKNNDDQLRSWLNHKIEARL